jgi:hypothetical protein
MAWKSVDGFDGYYEVSDTGKVRSVDRYITDSCGKTRLLKGSMMKQTEAAGRINSDGYYVVNLHKNHKSYVIAVHRIVATAFIENPDNYPTVNHIDGNKHNNNVRNLEWASYKTNNVHALKNALRKPRGTRVYQYDATGNFIAKYCSVCNASKHTGVSRSMISHCINGRSKSAGGYLWLKFEKCNDYLHTESTSDNELPMEVQEPRDAEDIVCSDRNI